ncbi:type II toxin-antitoxin system VapC family toxin [Aerosakkonemataceae cyanobacterium BLCC-F154]|uniref:Type II toxin-antitoxin system VapC family toxin n=1 Tax=Floridaenema fluviatile BLCC-F154 TaxID=3153640 RepID=A0ABV4YH63_9CYAN
MSLWILDTDCVSLFQRGHSLVSERVNAANPQELAVTIITLEEQLYGRLNPIRRANSRDTLISTYAKLRATINYFKTVNLLDFDQEAYSCYAELLRQRTGVGTQDLKIAAIAISRNAILVSRNSRDFEKVPGLVFEDWTIE